MSRSGQGLRVVRLMALVLAVGLCIAAVAPALGAGPTHGYRLTEECGYSGCHNGAPIPGTEPSVGATLTPCVPSAPKPGGTVRARRYTKFAGVLTPVPSEATSLTLSFERKRGKRFAPWGSVKLKIAAGAGSYSGKARLTTRGSWRVRASHVEADGTRTLSAWRVFKVR